MGNVQSSQSFGWDAPPRIMTTTTFFTGADDTMPGEPFYPSTLPFLPPSSSVPFISGGSAANGIPVGGEWDLTIYSGADFREDFLVKNADGTPSDLTGYTGLSEVRRAEDPCAHLIATFVVTFPAAGTVRLSLPAIDTALLHQCVGFYDVFLIGSSATIGPLVQGKVFVDPRVTAMAAP